LLGPFRLRLLNQLFLDFGFERSFGKLLREPNNLFCGSQKLDSVKRHDLLYGIFDYSCIEQFQINSDLE
jgi:hypothetical protein